MSRFLTGLLVALVVMTVALSGCGGGGGGGITPPTPPDTTERTITGTIVSSAVGNPPVPNVAVTVGLYTTVSGTDGTFRLGPMPINTDIPSTFTVDATGAGNGYRRDDLVTYNGQEYLYNAVDTPVRLRNADTNSMGTITVRYSPDDTPSIPFPNKDTIIAGRVVRSDYPSVGVAGVTVSFGTATNTTATTGAHGYFALNVGRDVSIVSLFLVNDQRFEINASGAGTGYTADLMVSYLGQSYRQDELPVPDDVLSNNSTDLGDITILVGGSGGGGGGGDVPPPPPIIP